MRERRNQLDGVGDGTCGSHLDVVAVTDARVLEDVGVVPNFGDDGGGVVGHEWLFLRGAPMKLGFRKRRI